MRINLDSKWDTYVYNYIFGVEVDSLDRAHKRAKAELRKQQKSIEQKNKMITFLREQVGKLYKDKTHFKKQLDIIMDKNAELVENKCLLLDNIDNLELKVTCLEQENKQLRKEHSKSETEIQGRIIQSMNDTIEDLRAQLNETEEKYNELLKHVIEEK